MSFFDEIKKDVGISDMKMLSGFSYVNFCGEALYIEGVKRLDKISNECILVRTSKAELEICGNLNVESVTENTIVIIGQIENVASRRLK